MAHLIFIAKGRDVGMFRLTGRDRAVTLGRDVDCDVFVPDVFVSRTHCKFEPVAGAVDEWAVVDARSTNGIWFRGRPVFRRVLRKGDTIEIGSVAFQFDDLDLAPTLSTPTPFGTGSSVATLMDTIFTQGMRPTQFLKSAKKKPQWVRAAEQAEAEARAAEEAAALEAAEVAARLDFSEPGELDLELQIAVRAAELQPAQVLVSAELVARALSILEGRSGGGTSDAIPLAAGGAMDVVGEEATSGGDLSSLLPGAATAPPPTGPVLGRGLGASLNPEGAGTAGQKKNLWEEAYDAAAEASEASSKEGRRKKKEAEKAARAAMKKAAKEGKELKSAKTDSAATPRRSVGEWFGDFSSRIDLDAIREGVRDNPLRAGIVGLAAMAIVGTVWWFNRPGGYHIPVKYDANGKVNPAFIQGSDN